MQIWEMPPLVKLVVLSGRRPAPFRAGLHDHPFYELGFLVEGQCDWYLDEERHPLQAGDAILLKPKTRHREVTSPGQDARFGWIGFEFAGPAPDWCQRAITTAEDFPEIMGYFEILAGEPHRYNHASSPIRLGLAAQSLLLLIARRAEGMGERSSPAGSDLNPRQIHCVESAAHYFRSNLADSLSIAQVAAYHSLCPAHFTNLFRRRYGTSPRSYLREARVARVAELLRSTEEGLKEIAAECGFLDAAHLCKAFKESQGVTPRTFRLQFR